MQVSKLRAAQIQIDSAIGLFLSDGNYVCSLTLAGAAEELLGNILRARGQDHVLAHIHKEFDLSFSEFKKEVNSVRDELKHSHENPDPHFKIEVSENDAALMIMRAIDNFQSIHHNHSQKMEDFYHWVKAHQDQFFTNDDQT